MSAPRGGSGAPQASVAALERGAGIGAAPTWIRLSRLAALWRGRAEYAPWVRPGLLGLLGATALLYLWNLGASGWANGFYSAAVQAGSTSWSAFFFGSFDASNFITVDKAPGALWLMDLSVRVFGLSTWSILVPEALAGVGTVALVYATVRRCSTPAAGLLAGAVVALTPVGALMFRFNNPDALLVLVLTAAAYATVRALEAGKTRWLVLAATLVGYGFLVKMLQAYLVMPAIALVFLVAAPISLRRRLVSLGATGLALMVSSGWWVAIVELIPAANRPYIGGSQDNTVLNLVFGYNGIGRLTGNETGSVGGNGPVGSMWGPTGWDRLFLPNFGGDISWLIPAAVVLLVAGLWLTRRAPRTDRTRAALLLWGGWLLVTSVVFSFAGGIIHPYYTVALAPPIGAIIGIGATMLWSRRSRLPWRLLLAAVVAGTVVWSFTLLSRSPNWYPTLRVAVLLAGLATAAGLALVPHLPGRVSAAVAVVALCAALAGPAAYTLDTVLVAHGGAIPSAGPAVAGGQGGPGGAPGGPGGGFAGGPPPGALNSQGIGPPPGGAGGFAGGRPPGGLASGLRSNQGGGPGGSLAGGLLDSSKPGSAVVSLLSADSGSYKWIAAAVGANSAAGYQLATNDPVMAIGGFNGTDPTPSLAAFQAAVDAHQVHYFIAGGGGGPGGGPPGGQSSQSSAITSWVESHYSPTTVDGVTLYDLTANPSS
ncbi:MAG TPA: glycosyltransferase family 39 protein [Candidatus Dormibacteraeota bacterium]|nr:glycosyltransferase family 39 protein [Candidatus Dormibacteraeota bacterium]